MLSPPVRVARMASARPALRPGDPAGEVVPEPDEQVGGRLGVRPGSMRLGELDAEEVRQRRQLVVLEVRIALAGDRQGVEVAALLEVRPVAQRRLDEGEVEPDRVPDDDRVTDELDGVARGVGRLGRLLDVDVLDAVHLVADDRTARVDQGRPAIGDLAALDLDGGDLDEVGHLGIGAGRLDVDDDELVTGVDGGREVEHGAGAGLEERRGLGLADGLAELLLDVDERLERAVAEQDRLGHDGLGQELGARLDHHDRVARPGDDEVELRVGQLAVGRVDHELAIDAADANGADRPRERDLADRQRGRRGDRPDDIGLVLLVGREDRDDELDVVLVALGEERADRAVGQAGGQGGRLRRARLALDEAARDLARGVHALLELHREREEVEARARIGPVGRAEHHGVAVADGDGAAGEAGKPAGLDGQRSATELRLECLRQGNCSSLVAEEGDDLRQVGRLGPGRRMRQDPGLCRGPGAATPSGGVRVVR